MQTAGPRRDDRRFTRSIALAVALTTLVTSGLADAASAICSAHSPAHRVALVELYSSEGCNSCPPADNWLSQWKNSGATQSIVPLALHVDYWNSLGWTDRFSQHRFTERQQTAHRSRRRPHHLHARNLRLADASCVAGRSATVSQSRIGKVVAEPAQANVALELKAQQATGAFNVTAQFTSKLADTAGQFECLRRCL